MSLITKVSIGGGIHDNDVKTAFLTAYPEFTGEVVLLGAGEFYDLINEAQANGSQIYLQSGASGNTFDAQAHYPQITTFTPTGTTEFTQQYISGGHLPVIVLTGSGIDGNLTAYDIEFYTNSEYSHGYVAGQLAKIANTLNKPLWVARSLARHQFLNTFDGYGKINVADAIARYSPATDYSLIDPYVPHVGAVGKITKIPGFGDPVLQLTEVKNAELYEIFRNDILLTTTDKLLYTDTTGEGELRYKYRAKLTNAYGTVEASEFSEILTVNTGITPVEKLRIEISAFGCQLSLFYDLPDELPTNYGLYVFKRGGEDVSQKEIDAYFEKGTVATGLFVMDRFTQNLSKHGVIDDIYVVNGTEYYYKAVIRDEDSLLYSLPTSVSGMPAKEMKVSCLDGKEIVATAIKKMFENVVTIHGEVINLSKDIKIVKNFSTIPLTQNTLMIERANGSPRYSFLAQIIANDPQYTMYGEIDVDVIRVTFVTQGSSERRDKVLNVFRANKSFLVKICKEIGGGQCTQCQINIEGDYLASQVHGVDTTGFTVVFELLIENKTLIPDELYEAIVTEMKVAY